MMSGRIVDTGRVLVQDVRLTDRGTVAEIILPSLSVDSIDRTGNIPIWSIARIFECSRVTAIVNPNFFFGKVILASSDNIIRTAFIVVINMDIEKSMYKKIHRRKYRPLKLTTSLTGFGRTSMNYITTIVDPHDGETLATLRFKYASVDTSTRKSTPIPDDIVRDYNVYSKPDLAVQGYKPRPLPTSGAHRYEYTICPSDIDHNNHLNNSVYLRLCMDCAAEAGFDGCLKKCPGDVADLRVRRVQGLYSRECRLGDRLQVYCWEEDSDRLEIHFEICNNDKSSFHCCIEFYSVGGGFAKL